MNSIENTCQLCNRLLAEPSNKHHLKPMSQGGKGTTTVILHKICHDKIHSVISEKSLAKEYFTIEKLQKHEEIQKFIQWISKKPVEFYDHSCKKKL